MTYSFGVLFTFFSTNLEQLFLHASMSFAYLSMRLSIVNLPRPLEDSKFLPYHPQSGHSGLLSTSSTCVILLFIWCWVALLYSLCRSFACNYNLRFKESRNEEEVRTGACISGSRGSAALAIPCLRPGLQRLLSQSERYYWCNRHCRRRQILLCVVKCD